MPESEGRSKRYRIITIQEVANMPGMPLGQNACQVTATPVNLLPGGSPQPITWTFDGEDYEWATNYFVVGDEFDNSFTKVAEPE